MRKTHSHHRYVIEPQSLNYTAHGDLWDFLYEKHRASTQESVFLPLTLELSAAAWYSKNPAQLFSRVGFFHPVKPHRLTRVLRRHEALFDFLLRAIYSHESWLPRLGPERQALRREAIEYWNLIA